MEEKGTLKGGRQERIGWKDGRECKRGGRELRTEKRERTGRRWKGRLGKRKKKGLFEKMMGEQ